MRIAKQCHYNADNKDQQSYVLAVDNDLTNIFNALKGRIRFGDSVNGTRGENISGEFRVFTTDATPNVEFSVLHTLDAFPQGWLVVSKNKAGDLYLGSSTWTKTTAFFKCSVASVTYKIFLLK